MFDKSDEQLITQALQGNKNAWLSLLKRYEKLIYNYGMRMTGKNEDALDLMQEVFISVFRNLSTYRGEAALFTWLCTFCRHEISAYFKRNRIVARKVDLIEDAPEVRAAMESLGATFAGPESALDREELGRLVQVALDQLPRNYGNVLEWKYLDDESVKQIAGRLKLSPKAAESLLTRARDAFRDCFSTLTRSPRSTTSHLKPAESST